MRTRNLAGFGFQLAVDHPVDWHFGRRLVPNLYSPRELCTISNRPLRPVPVTSTQNRPDLSNLDSHGYLIWIYYEVLGEVIGDPTIPDPTRPPIPDYSRYSYPLAYSESQLFPRLSYDWGSDLQWRRVGHNLGPTAERPEPAALTVMVWEGVRTSAADLRIVEGIVSSVSVSYPVASVIQPG